MQTVLVELYKEGYHWEKVYRVEVTADEVVVWHDHYDKEGNPVMDSKRKMIQVTRTRIQDDD
jgi:hypothetical protein